MINLAYAAPYIPPVPGSFEPWKRIKHTWTGWDGSVWNISDPKGGVFLLAKGLEGLHLPEIRNYTSDSPVVHGVQWEGWLAVERKVFWNIGIYHDGGSVQWIARNRAFWKTLRPGKTGVWSIELPSGEVRSLTLRLGDTDSHTQTWDPVKRGWDAYQIKLFPEQPFWEAAPVIKQWESGEQIDFFGPTGFGPDFYISPSSQLESAIVTNSGDVESYARWTVTGPTDAVEVGVGTDVTPIPFIILEGQKLILDSNPLNLIAELDGQDVMEQLTDFGPPPIPPGEDVALGLSMDGTGKVQVEFTPLYLTGV